MKVLLCLCVCVAAATAHGVIGYPAVPLAYHNAYISPLITHGYPVPVGPYFSYNLIPNNVVFPGIPGIVHYIPLAPSNGKGKPDKKKPGKDGKEETTEEPKTEEEPVTKPEETEDLAQ